MAIKRREFIGGATETSLSSGINSTATTISVADGSGFPTGGDFPFVIVVDRGESDEEKVLIASRSSNTLTVATNYGGVVSGRAFDDTSGASHDSGSKVAHVLDATTMTDLSQSSYDTEVLYWMGGT